MTKPTETAKLVVVLFDVDEALIQTDPGQTPRGRGSWQLPDADDQETVHEHVPYD
jgi:hypothetical protein